MRLHIMLQACLALTAALAAAQQEDCPPLVDLVAGLNSSLLADALATQEDAAAAGAGPSAAARYLPPPLARLPLPLPPARLPALRVSSPCCSRFSPACPPC